MKWRATSGSLTVTGPPSAIWRWKSGTTEPEEPITLPKRTVTSRRPSAAGESASAWQ